MGMSRRAHMQVFEAQLARGIAKQKGEKPPNVYIHTCNECGEMMLRPSGAARRKCPMTRGCPGKMGRNKCSRRRCAMPAGTYSPLGEPLCAECTWDWLKAYGRARATDRPSQFGADSPSADGAGVGPR